MWVWTNAIGLLYPKWTYTFSPSENLVIDKSNRRFIFHCYVFFSSLLCCRFCFVRSLDLFLVGCAFYLECFCSIHWPVGFFSTHCFLVVRVQNILWQHLAYSQIDVLYTFDAIKGENNIFHCAWDERFTSGLRLGDVSLNDRQSDEKWWEFIFKL